MERSSREISRRTLLSSQSWIPTPSKVNALRTNWFQSKLMKSFWDMHASHLLRPSALSIKHANMTKTKKRVTFSDSYRKKTHYAACPSPQTLWGKSASHASLMLCANNRLQSAMITQFVGSKWTKVQNLVKFWLIINLLTKLKVG